MLSKPLKCLFAGVFFVVLSGCSDEDPASNTGGGAGSSTAQPVSVSVTPSLGRIQNADVRILSLDETPIDGASGSLDETGSVVIELPENFSDPIIVEVVGDDDATYFDEATGLDQPFPEGRSLRAILSEPQDQVAVTPLTEIATARFQASGGTSAADVEAANEAVRQEFLPGVSDITVPPNLISSSSDSVGTESQADLYALFLATLSELSMNAGGSILDLLDQFSEDFSDGNLDGLVDGTALETTLIDSQNSGFDDLFNTALSGALSDFTSGGNAADVLDAFDEDVNSSSSGNNNDGHNGSNGSDANGTTNPADINEELVGEYTLIYHENAPGAPFEDGEEVEVSISSSGTLKIGGTSYDSPFNRDLGAGPHLPEIIWLDSTDNIEFALSDNERGTFNEINVGDTQNPQGTMGIPGFLGQLRPEAPETDPSGVLSSVASTVMGTVITASSIPPIDGTEVGDTLNLVIDSDGVSTIGSFTFDPEAEGMTATDSRATSTQKPGIYLGRYINETDTETLRIYLDLAGENVIGFELETATQTGPGAFAVRKLNAEVRPLAMEIVDFFDLYKEKSETVLTIVEDNDVNTQKLSYAAGTPYGGNGLCQPVRITVGDKTPDDGLEGLAIALNKPDVTLEDYFYLANQSRIIRDEEAEADIITFSSSEHRLYDSGVVEILDGFLTTSTGRVGTASERATTDETEIESVCGDYEDINISFLNDTLNNLSGSFKVKESGDEGAILMDLTLNSIAAGESVESTYRALPGTEFVIEQSYIFPSINITCLITNDAGTVDSDSPVPPVEITCSEDVF